MITVVLGSCVVGPLTYVIQYNMLHVNPFYNDSHSGAVTTGEQAPSAQSQVQCISITNIIQLVY